MSKGKMVVIRNGKAVDVNSTTVSNDEQVYSHTYKGKYTSLSNWRSTISVDQKGNAKQHRK